MRLIDTHAHLSDLTDMEGVVRRAKEVGVKAIVAVSANLRSCAKTLLWAKEFPGYVHPALGLHPTELTGDNLAGTLQFIKKSIGECIAVGEIGLDYWRGKTEKDGVILERQREIYKTQLELAEEHNKPVSVHGRGAWRDALKFARRFGPGRVVFHWYSGPLDLLEEVMDSGYFISATQAAEFSRDHRAAIADAPLDRVLIETDSPVGYHGKSSEPANLVRTLRAVAELRRMSAEELAEVTTRNAERFFCI